MTTTPKTALFCAHADVNGDAARCACAATPPATTASGAALDLLLSCQGLLMCARMDALVAAFNLSGARAGSARQLAELVIDRSRLL